MGLIGASGYWAARLLPNLQELQGYELVAGSCHSKPLACLEGRPRHPTRSERGYAALMADPGIDAVLIATPAATHYDIVRRALQAGKHVLVERPLALCARDADRVVRLADREALVLMVDHTYLVSLHIIEIRNLSDWYRTPQQQRRSSQRHH